MDDTQASLKGAEAATRKRRSSILKSQRPPRTPLSELEFHIATPTDTAKSRRVSFSKRTGVAEFVTNEATTTWKNFYEEHNKSLESSGNESAANAIRPSIGHIGKRIFDQQFEEVLEVIDIGDTLQTNRAVYDFQSSLNNINLAQQLTAFELECLGEDKLSAPVKNFELSSLPDQHSKIFGDDLSIPVTNEMSNPISINFSNLIPLSDKCDDLDEIQRDLARPHSQVRQSAFSGNVSEYIEIDLNMTNVGVRNDDNDMSITDTIHSPKVQAVSNNISSIEKKLNDEWVVDKENIAINPYTTPKESLNFAINEADDEVLVFDGKKLRIQSEKQPIPDLESDRKHYNISNVKDDLPNIATNTNQNIRKSVLYNDCDLSITQAVGNKIDIPKRKTIVFEDDMGNISITQAVPAKVIINEQEKHKTVIYENFSSNMSITQPGMPVEGRTPGRKTVVYEDDISFTQALIANIILNKTSQNKTVYFNDGLDISVTQMVPGDLSNIRLENANDISMTQVIPSNILTYDLKATEVSEPIISNVNIVSESIMPNNERRKTIIYEDTESGNVSITEAIPTNILLEKLDPVIKCENSSLTNITEKPTSKRTTIIFDNNEAEVSMTQAIPSNIVPISKPQCDNDDKTKSDETKVNRRKTIIYGSEDGDISITQVLPENIQKKTDKVNSSIKEFVKKTIIYDDTECDISITQAIPYNIVPIESEIKDIEIKITDNSNKGTSDRRKTVIFDYEDGDVSMTQVMPTNIKNNLEVRESDMTFNDNNMDISVTRPLPTNILLTHNQNFDDPPTSQQENAAVNLTNVSQRNIISTDIDTTKSTSEEHLTLSLKDPLCNELIEIQNDNFKNSGSSSFNKSLTYNVSGNHDILVYQNVEHNLSRSKITNDHQEVSKKCNTSFELISCNEIMDEGGVQGEDRLNETNRDKTIEEVEEEILNTNDKEENEEQNPNKNHSYRQSTDVKNAVSTQNRKKSIISELLDMSNASLEDIKNSTVVDTENSSKKIVDDMKPETKSSDSLFIIISDSENEIKKENNINDDIENISKNSKLKSTLRKSLEYHDIELNDLRNKIAELKTINNEKPNTSNRHYEKILSSDLQKTIENIDKSLVGDYDSSMKRKKSIADADNTKALLEMLSELTDEPKECNEKSGIIKNRASEKFEPTRVSALPKRHSIALSREDLLNNISMAQAVLQQSHFNADDSNSADESHESNDSPEETRKPIKKSVRMSTDVVKTLQFEDESMTDISTRTDLKTTPLKKTAFGEITYLKDDKSKVIPTYLKDVSDGIKSLMHDLVKPTADMPFDVDRSTKKSPSTCSTQIQATLVTSSQIDIDYELRSNAESAESVKQIKMLAAEVATIGNKAVAQALRHCITPAKESSMEVDQTLISKKVTKQGPATVKIQSKPCPVIVFDHLNPLNNILLAPSDYSEVHAYSPINPDGSLSKSSKSDVEKNKENEIEIERVSIHYDISRLSQSQSELQSGDGVEKIKESSSLASNTSKPVSIDRSTEGIVTEVKDIDVNTLIAMKGNRDLLEADSSLTLVDDALDQPLDVNMEDVDKQSPLRVLYKVNEDDISEKDSEFMTDFSDINSTKPRKRSYSPTREGVTPIVDITPKPVSKIQKISNSPKVQGGQVNNVDLTVNSVSPQNESVKDKNSRLTPKTLIMAENVKIVEIAEKNVPKKKTNQDLTVQQLITDCYIDAGMKHNTDDKSEPETLEPETISETVVSSNTTFTSSKNAMDANMSKVTKSSVTLKSASLSLKSLTECSTGSNVVAKIDMLPFMGTRDCEWESSSSDQWVFLLLRSRLRLTVRIAHTHHNSSRSLVRADTPLKSLTVDLVNGESKEPASRLCLRLACEAMRYECSLCRGAGGVPALLRRCHEVARVALLWARVMRDARLRLAYTVTPDGDLTLKVANIPLRSVWEVHMKIELVVDDDSQSAWPRAGAVRVSSVLSDAAPTPSHVSNIVEPVKHDWGHVPTTIWKLFRYLKNKTRDDGLGFCFKN